MPRLPRGVSKAPWWRWPALRGGLARGWSWQPRRAIRAHAPQRRLLGHQYTREARRNATEKHRQPDANRRWTARRPEGRASEAEDVHEPERQGNQPGVAMDRLRHQ